MAREGERYARWARRATAVLRPSAPLRERLDRSASAQMRSALVLSGLGLRPHEVAIPARMAAALTGAAALPVAIAAALLLGLSPFPDGLLVLLAASAVPLLVLSFLEGRPLSLASRLRARSQGDLPEAVHHLVMAMRVNPSLDGAVAFAAENTEGPVSSGLRRVLWEVHLRKHQSIEESFLEFADQWGASDEDFKRALLAVRAAEMEGTREGLGRALDKAAETALAGTRQRMERFAASLTGPTLALFTLGLLLPMMLGALLPMASLGGLRLGPLEAALLLDVAFPLAALSLALRVAAKRPGSGRPAPPPRGKMSSRSRSILAGSLAGGALLVGFAVPQLLGALGEAGRALGPLAFLWGIALPLSVFCLLPSLERKEELDRVRRLEGELADALFLLGSRMGEGLSVEAALALTAATCRGTEAASLFGKIATALKVESAPLEEVLFGPRGLLRDHPSRTVRAVLRTAVESVGKDSAEAGRSLVGLAGHLRDQKRVEHDTHVRLGSVMDTMRMTGMFFAPLVMGITAALFGVLSGVSADLQGAGAVGAGPGAAIPAPAFTLIVGVYLLLAAAVTSFFTTLVRHGPDRVETMWEMGRALPVAAGVFTASVLAGQLLL